MANFAYTVIQNAGEITGIRRNDGAPVTWSDPAFQSWNAAQPTPYQLSAAQQAIQAAKAMTFAQFQTWWASATAAQQQRLIYELLQRALKGEIV